MNDSTLQADVARMTNIDNIEVLPRIGWRVKTTPRCHVEVWTMAFGNLRRMDQGSHHRTPPATRRRQS